MSWMSVLLVSLAWATPTRFPDAASLDSALEGQVLGGGIVVLPTVASSTGITVTGVAELDTTEDRLWDALLDFPARLKGNSSLKAVLPYQGVPQLGVGAQGYGSEQWWKFEVSVLGYPISYHNHYRFDRKAGWLVHELDHNMPNDLVDSWGIFQVFPGRYKSHRLQYTASTNVGRSLPGMVEEWLGGKGVTQFLVDVVNRAKG